jgi:hypothetical protein
MNILTISTVLLPVVVKQFKYTIIEDRFREQMNHKNTTLAIVAIVAAVAMTAAAFALPQQAIAHYGHHHHYSNTIDINQNISQANLCSDSLCVNDASNSAEIHR